MSNKKILVVATGNRNKLREIGEIFPEYIIVSQKEAGFDAEVEETGSTFSENAVIKAQAASNALQLPVIADDSGLCVEALNGAPGVFSARYSGEHGNDAANRQRLLENMQGIGDRRAYFSCAVAFVDPKNGKIVVAEGKTFGRILTKECGEGGFGYDPLFFSDDLQKSFGEAAAREKNTVSHRYRALMELRKKLDGIL